jgi:coenzyme F420-dependent glucose-6-phosphate dehydrogenase
MISRLWAGETVDGEGRFFKTKQAKLHTLPERPPPLYVSAFHSGAAKVAARYGDGLWTLADPDSTPKLIEIYRAEREAQGKELGEIVIQESMSWAQTDDEALEGCRVWKGASPPEYYVDDWHDPRAMYEHAEEVLSDDDYKKKSIISADPDEHVRRLKEVERLGATTLAIMNTSGADPEGAIRVYAERVLPALRS